MPGPNYIIDAGLNVSSDVIIYHMDYMEKMSMSQKPITNYDSPEKPILRLYELISGPADWERPWEKIAELYWPGARLRIEMEQNDGTIRSCDWSVDEFIAEAKPHYQKAGFWEIEISREVFEYGHIAHILSAYESRINSPDSQPIARGINSVQVLKRKNQWRMAGIIFQKESPDLAIPDKFLNK